MGLNTETEFCVNMTNGHLTYIESPISIPRLDFYFNSAYFLLTLKNVFRKSEMSSNHTYIKFLYLNISQEEQDVTAYSKKSCLVSVADLIERCFFLNIVFYVTFLVFFVLL